MGDNRIREGKKNQGVVGSLGERSGQTERNITGEQRFEDLSPSKRDIRTAWRGGFTESTLPETLLNPTISWTSHAINRLTFPIP